MVRRKPVRFNPKLRSISDKFIHLLRREVKENPDHFFLESDVRCFAYSTLYRLLKRNGLLRTRVGMIRLRSDFNPYSYRKTAKNANRNFAYDLAVLDDRASDAPLCVFEFKFRKFYRLNGRREQCGRATLHSFREDYLRLVPKPPGLKYCVLVHIDSENLDSRSDDIDQFISKSRTKTVKLHYLTP